MSPCFSFEYLEIVGVFFRNFRYRHGSKKMKEPPVYTTDNFAYIKCAEIGDEKVRGDFEKWIIGKTIPLLDGEKKLGLCP